MSTLRDGIPDTVLQTQVFAVRSLIGTERFNQAAPDQTIRPSTIAMPGPADIPTLKYAAPGLPHETLLADAALSPTLLSPNAPGIPVVSTHDTYARAGEYTLRERVGKGGMGEVFLAAQNSLRREVAVKRIIPEHLKDGAAEKFEDSFVSEALVTGFLDHPNIVPVHSLGRDESGNWFFSMKIVRGIEWRYLLHPEYCKDSATKEKALARKLGVGEPTTRAAHLEENLRILLSVCNAVAFAHSKQIIHRDLKPENVMVGAFGEVLVMDWGLAVDVSDNPAPPGHPDRRVASRGESGFGGTPSYMAPEQFAFDENQHPTGAQLGPWTDVFLLGGMLYEVLTGRAPYVGRRLEDALREVAECAQPPLPENTPPELLAICRKALNKNPRDRYADAAAFQKAVQEFLTHREASAIASKAELEAKTPEIPNLARAVVLYDQALELWPGNAAMAQGVKAAREKLARKESHARWIRRSLSLAVAGIVLGLTVGFFWIRSEQQKAVAEKVRADANEKTAIAAYNVAENALKEQRRLAFEASFRNAEADDAQGNSAKVITELEPYLPERELAQHPLHAKAEKLVETARDGFKRHAAFAEEIRTGAKSAALNLGNGVKLEVVLIPAGTFLMGSPLSEKDRSPNEQQHAVTISKPFYMGKFHVTQEQYEAVAGSNPSYFKGKPKNPVEEVTWFEAVAFCEKLEKQSGASVHFSLPTEAEWEYACRAGTQTRFYFGDNENELEQYAWCSTNAGDGTAGYGTHPVGEKNRPNKFGLHDMHGNVYAWCQDWYDGRYYLQSPKVDPAGPATGEIIKSINGGSRVLRGGSWDYGPEFCRSASRLNDAPNTRGDFLGFRVVVRPSKTAQ